MWKKIKNTLIYIFVLGLITKTRMMPRRLAFFCLGGLGSLLYYLIPAERKKAVNNLKSIFGGEKSVKEFRRIAKKVFRNLGRNAVDIIRLKKMGRDRFFRNRVTCVGWSNLEEAYQKGNGVICFTGHLGAFELLHHYIAWRGYRICVTGTKIYDARLNKLVVSNRLAEGITYVERGEDSGISIIRHLKSGDLFGALIDQDTNVEGVFAPFLGREAYTPSTPVKLAMKTKAPIVPLTVKLGNDLKHHIAIEPALEMVDSGNFEEDLIENVKRCNDRISAWIQETPDQWVWMHERWKTKRTE